MTDVTECKFEAPVSKHRNIMCKWPCYLINLAVSGKKLSEGDGVDPQSACKIENKNSQKILIW